MQRQKPMPAYSKKVSPSNSTSVREGRPASGCARGRDAYRSSRMTTTLRTPSLSGRNGRMAKSRVPSSSLRSSSATGIALETGYRHIDTAQAYYNEECVGRAVA